MILKQRNNLMKNLILIMEYFQEKEDLVKLENVEVNQIIYLIKNMQLKLCKVYQVLQILEKLKLYKKLKINQIIIQYNIMIVDIDNNNNNFKFMNILQLKWMQQILILKKNYKKILNKINQLIINKFIHH